MNTTDQGAMEDLQCVGDETSTNDTTDASLLVVTEEMQNFVPLLKICYEGHFYEKYTANQFMGRLPANNDRAASLARRTSWFENRRFLFDTKTKTAQEDGMSSDVSEEEDVCLAREREGETKKVDVNESLEFAHNIEEEESEWKFCKVKNSPVEQQSSQGNSNIEELHLDRNEFDEQPNGHLYQHEQEFVTETKRIEQSSSIHMTNDTFTSSENYAMPATNKEPIEKQDQVNEKVKRILGMSDDYNNSIKENGGNINSSNGLLNGSSKRGSNVFIEGVSNVKQKITRQLSRSLSFRKKSTSTSKKGDDVIWIQAPKDAEEYPMRHQRRGVALIFNNNVFERLAPRHSTERECHDLATELTTVGFQVQVHHDLDLAQLKSVLLQTSEMDHSDADCVLVAVLTVRQHGSLFAKDLPYEETMLWKRFTGDKCSTLIGKPKIFLIDACREVRASLMSRAVNDVTDSTSVSHMVPVEADILTVTWYYPWRDVNQGSWFVRALCDELKANANTRDLLTLLTFVNRRVALLCTSADDDSERSADEMPTFTSMLTRQVYFRSKNSHKKVGGV